MPKISSYTSRASTSGDDAIISNGTSNFRIPIGDELADIESRITSLEGGGATTHKSLWLSPDAIPAGVAQTGSRGNPLDASTSTKLDAIYAANASNVSYMYLPGVFETGGWSYTTVQSLGDNTSHIGSGMGVSTLRLVGATGASATSDGAILATDYGVEVDNVTVKGLTLDVNAANNTAFTGGAGALIAFRAYGNNIRVSECEIIGFGTGSGDECFPVVVGRTRTFAQTDQAGCNVVENCIFHSQAANSLGPITCILMGTQGAGSNIGYFLRNDIVRGCQFYNLKRPANESAVHGVTAPIVLDCIFDGIDDPVYVEAQSAPYQSERVDYDHMIVQGCTFRDYKFGVTMRQADPAVALKSWSVRGNHFYSRAGTHRTEGVALAILTAVTDAAKACERVIIEDNVAVHMDGSIGTPGLAGGTCFLWGYSEGGGTKVAKNVVIRNNVVDLRDSVYLALNDVAPQASCIENETITGNIMADGTSMDTNLSLLVL